MRLAAAGVFALALAVYLNALCGEFVWDDRPLILGDYMVKSFDHLYHLFSNDFFFRDENDMAYGYYRPVTTLTYVIDYALHADRPLGFHLTNALLHGFCSLLVVLLLRRLGFAPLTAVVSGALFAVHPIHTESVAWIAGRTDLMAFALASLAFLVHLVGLDERRSPPRRRLLAIAAGVCFALALLAKEMAVVLIPWLALYHLILRRDAWSRTLRALVPTVAVAVAYGVWRFAVIDVPTPGQPEDHGTGAALLSVAPTVARYLLWLVAPVDQTAYVQNPYVTSPLDWRFLAGVAVLVAFGALAWKRARSSPTVLFAVTAAAVSFVPIVNLVRVAAPDDMGAVMAERFAYFPSLWLLALVALGMAALLRWVGNRRPARVAIAILVVVVLALLSTATVLRNRVWRDERVLFEDALERAPDAPLLWGNLANHHLRAGDLSAAEAALAKLESLAPDSYFALSSRALSHVMAGRLEQAVDLQERVVLSSRRRNQVAINNLAYLYRVTGRTERARDLLEDLIAAGKGYSDVRFNMAEIERGDGDFAAARRDYRLALRDQPDNRRIGTALAQMELRLGRHDEAERVFQELLRFHPDNAGLLNNLALVYRQQGEPERAIEVLERALKQDPGYDKARQQLAEIRRLRDRGAAEP
jgi:tetratricopeptide (TPR) repeat protein